MLTPFLFWHVNLIVIVVLSGIDSSTNGFTNIVPDKLIKFWRRPFTRKRVQQTNHSSDNNNNNKQLVPVVHLFRRPKLQDLSGLNGLNGLSGSNVPGYVTIADSDFPDDDNDGISDNNNNYGLNPIINGLNSAVQSLGLSNLNLPGPNLKGSSSSSVSEDDRIPIGGSYDLNANDDYTKQIQPMGKYGHEFYHHHFPFHHYPFRPHWPGHWHKKSKVHYIPMPFPYPVYHVKHVKHHHNDHKNDVSHWVWGILLTALLPLLLGALLLPLGLLFALNLFTLLAVLSNGNGQFIPINGTVATGRRKRSLSAELFDQKTLDEVQALIIDSIKKFQQ